MCSVYLLRTYCVCKRVIGIDLWGGVTLFEIQIYVSSFVCPPVTSTQCVITSIRLPFVFLLFLNNKKRFALEVITDQINRFVCDYDPSILRHPLFIVKICALCSVCSCVFFIIVKFHLNLFNFSILNTISIESIEFTRAIINS